MNWCLSKVCCFSGKQQVKACEQSFISACVADVLSSDGGFFFFVWQSCSDDEFCVLWRDCDGAATICSLTLFVFLTRASMLVQWVHAYCCLKAVRRTQATGGRW